MCKSAAILTALCSTGVGRHDAAGLHLAQVPAPIRRADAQRLQPQADGLASLMQDAGARRLTLPHSCITMLSILTMWYRTVAPSSSEQVANHQKYDTDVTQLHFLYRVRPSCVAYY